MRSLQDGNKKRAAVVLCVLLTAGACAQRSHKSGPATPAPTLPEQSAAVQQPPQPVYTGPLQLHEVRLIETAGQHSILFRFSRPPEGIDYFPLRSPSRLVIDIKGPLEILPKVHIYKAADPLVSAVRVGSYQGRMRLVVDLKGGEVPQFSVDNYDTLLTAFIGEKSNDKAHGESNAQVLFISNAARNGHFAQVTPAVATAPAAPVVEPAPPAVSSDQTSETSIAKNSADAVPAELPQETLPPTPATPLADSAIKEEPIAMAQAAPATETTTAEKAPPVETAQPTSASVPAEGTQEAPPSAPPTFSANAVTKEPVEIAQATPAAEVTPSTPPKEKSERKEPSEETLPSAAREESASSAPEFRVTSVPEYTGRKISLDFKNADIHDVLRIIADVSGLNVVATDDVKARVTLRLVEVPWDQALEVVLQANGLEKARAGNVITISTTRRLEAERNARIAAQATEQKLAPLETSYTTVNYIKATEIVALIAREAQRTAGPGGAAGAAPARAPAAAGGAAGGARTQVALMSPRGTITADPTTNVVIIRDVRENIIAVRELIRNVDVQTPQVVIESYLVTANENLIRDLGIQWGYRQIASPETGNPTGVNFPGRIALGGSGLTSGTVPFIADFPSITAAPGAGSVLDLALGSLSGSQTLNLRLSALETQGKLRVISRPRVVTINNKIADIRSRRVVRVPIISGALTVGGAGTVGGGNAFQEFDVGITLKVTPQISSDGFVLLDIDAETSELTDASVQPTGAGSAFPRIPDTLTRTASSSVLIRAGDTFVLGGILQDTLDQRERGIPYLRDTPGLGWLFRGRLNSRVKSELMVFITPKLVAGISTTVLPSAQQLWESRSKERAPSAPSQSQP